MCGRVTRKSEKKRIEEEFQIFQGPEELPITYNLCPGQDMAVVTEEHGRRLRLFHWGLVCPWDQDKSFAYQRINARAETVSEKTSYKNAFQKQRCLLVIDGFYEWKRDGKFKQPYYFKMKSDKPFALAGLWEKWGEDFFSCCVITTDAFDLIRPVHDRSPVILTEKEFDPWLDPKYPIDKVKPFLMPFSGAHMNAYPVSSLVNAPKNNSPECIRPIEAPQMDLF